MIKSLSSSQLNSSFAFFTLFAFIISFSQVSFAALSIASSGVLNVHSNSAEIVWQTGAPATSKVEFSEDSRFLSGSKILYQGDLQQNHDLKLSALKAGITYYYQISSLSADSSYAITEIFSFQTPPQGSEIPLTSSDWSTAYDGFGYVNYSELNNEVEFAPMAATNPNETHAVLLLSNRLTQQPLRNFRATITVNTVSQLRSPMANAWECFWFLFNYTVDSNGKKKTNYITLKPNGVELGTAFDEIGQTFLATNSNFGLDLNQYRTFVIEKFEGKVSLKVDGITMLNFESVATDNLIYNESGTVGLYSEDAKIKVSYVGIEPL